MVPLVSGRLGAYDVTSTSNSDFYAATSVSLNAEVGIPSSISATVAASAGSFGLSGLGISAYASGGVGIYPQGGTASQSLNTGVTYNAGIQASVGIGPLQFGYALEATGFVPFDSNSINNQNSSYQNVTGTIMFFGTR